MANKNYLFLSHIWVLWNILACHMYQYDYDKSYKVAMKLIDLLIMCQNLSLIF